MRGKTVNFERGQDPKDSMNIGLPVPDYDDIIMFLLEDERGDEMERYVNELIDEIYRELPRAKPEDVVKAITTITEENLDNWFQMTDL